MKPLTVAADQSGVEWLTIVYKTIQAGGQIFVKIVGVGEVAAVTTPIYDESKFDVVKGKLERERLFGFDATQHYLAPLHQTGFIEYPPPWEPVLYRCPENLEARAFTILSRELATRESLVVHCDGKVSERQLFIETLQSKEAGEYGKPLQPETPLKICTSAGLGKLKALFADLEQQRMVSLGTTEMLEDHFTESALDEAVPEDTSPIEWTGNLYELRLFVRSLRYAEWIAGTVEEQARHFTYEGKPVARKQLSAGEGGYEKLSRLKTILARHGIRT